MRFDAMDLKLYDTLTREKRVFAPLDPANVRMYVCGPTVYDFAHIGNARPVIVFDVLFRLLRHIYGADHVTYVRNITDVDDKINARAAEEYPDLPLNEAIRQVTEKTEAQFHKDVDALGCLRPTFEPRATEFIVRNDAPIDMVRLINRLIDNEHAYPAEGHVLFDVSSMPEYGMLVKQPLDEMLVGARVDPAPYKRNPMDFVLWKPSKPGEPYWPSPWGMGRPGWHIECSAMSAALLGKVFDIHGGGIDLLFPHHENEIAQSRCAFHTPTMANYWVHNGFLLLEGKKMSKSEGNFVTIRDLGRVYPGDVLRLLMLTKHYRQSIDWTREGLEFSRNELLSWSELVFDQFGPSEELGSLTANLDRRLVGALLDDLNTPLALMRLREMYRSAKGGVLPIEDFAFALRWLGFRNINKPGFFHPGFDAHLYESGPELDRALAENIVALRAAVANGFVETASLLMNALSNSGFEIQLNDAGVIFVGNKTSAGMTDLEGELKQKVESRIAARNAARARKDWDESDRIRDELAAMGVVLKDTKDGTTWEIAR
jgi:cysteinyl-tRNA synthetase